MVVVAGAFGSVAVAVIDVESEKLIGYYQYGWREMGSIAVSPDGIHVGITGTINTNPEAHEDLKHYPDVRIWNVETGKAEIQ